MQVLAIGAHPDDIEIGCGGTLLALAGNGHEIHLYIASNGEKGGSRERYSEQQCSAAMLNASLTVGRFPDTGIACDNRLIGSLEELMLVIRPDLIFVHDSHDTHQDHRNLSIATMTAARHRTSIVYYEGFSTVAFIPNISFGLNASQFERKLALLRCFESQMDKVVRGTDLTLPEAVRANALFRGIHARTKYAESFVAERFLLNDVLISDHIKDNAVFEPVEQP